jgi:hypothetical protein
LILDPQQAGMTESGEIDNGQKNKGEVRGKKRVAQKKKKEILQ